MTTEPLGVVRRLSGHTLCSEGAPFDQQGKRIGWSGTSGSGRAKCSCGAFSPVLMSGNERKAWHRKHKELARGMTDRLGVVPSAEGLETAQAEGARLREVMHTAAAGLGVVIGGGCDQAEPLARLRDYLTTEADRG